MKENQSTESPKIILAVTGASGAGYARLLADKLLELSPAGSTLDMVFSETGQAIWRQETDNAPILPGVRVWDNHNFSAPFASGSSRYQTLIICPCSMGTVGRIASGTAESLITRAADVMLKERRRVILVPRETPFSLIHLRNLEQLTLAGAIVVPASPSFYNHPATLTEALMTVVDRVLDLSGFPRPYPRWGTNTDTKQTPL